jgi:hypothetical protein
MMNANENPKCKKEQKEILLFEKTNMLDKLEKEMSIVVIRHKCGLNKSIIFYIKKNGNNISETIAARASPSKTIPWCNSSLLLT